MKKKLLIIIISVLLLFSSTSITFGWFISRTSVNLDFKGSVVTSYFHCGTGTENDPYVITRPKHLYNLTMLYQNLEGFDDEGIYFQIGYDLDNSGILKVYNYSNDGHPTNTYSTTLNMNYYTEFVPIGTVTHPFKGIFNGNGCTINNLTITGSGETDIGTFGYVAAEANIQNLYLNNITIDITGGSYTSHVSHTNSKCYLGYIAGHIVTAGSFSNVYVNNCNISGQLSGFTSDWGYFGHCEDAAEVDDFIAAAGGGTDNNWGGSFNSRDYTALGYSIRPTSSGIHTKQETGAGGYTMSFSASSNANPDSAGIIYRLRDGSYIPLKFGQDGKAALSNTGYLVGSNVGTGVNASPKIASYRLVNIGNALSNTAYTNLADTYSTSKTANISYNDSKLEVLTYYNGNWVRIKDEHNTNNNTTNTQIRNYTRTDLATLNLVKYTESRNALQEHLEGQSFVHGIHFDNNQVSKSNLLTIPANVARVNGTQYATSYQVPKGSINFSLKEHGIINFFAGTYNSSNVNLNFFSLYEVFRSGGTITDIKEIVEIYADANDDNKVVYKYSDNTYSAGTRGNSLFNVATILKGNAPVKNMLYYFEVPVNGGEYAMGVAGSTQGAYMIYLDLCANGNAATGLVDDFGSIEYRSASATTEHSILLLRFDTDVNLEISIEVEFDIATNTYEIRTSQNIAVQIVMLSTDYNFIFNGETLSPQVGYYIRT